MTAVFWPGESHGQRSLPSCIVHGVTKSRDMTEWLSLTRSEGGRQGQHQAPRKASEYQAREQKLSSEGQKEPCWLSRGSRVGLGELGGGVQGEEGGAQAESTQDLRRGRYLWTYSGLRGQEDNDSMMGECWGGRG